MTRFYLVDDERRRLVGGPFDSVEQARDAAESLRRPARVARLVDAASDGGETA